MEIRVKLNPLKATTTFPYLGRNFTYNNSNWKALYRILKKSQSRWRMLAKVMGKMGAPINARSMMYTAVVQAVLMYVSEIWLMVDAMMTVLEGFHHRIGKRIVRMTAWRGYYRVWD